MDMNVDIDMNVDQLHLEDPDIVCSSLSIDISDHDMNFTINMQVKQKSLSNTNSWIHAHRSILSRYDLKGSLECRLKEHSYIYTLLSIGFNTTAHAAVLA